VTVRTLAVWCPDWPLTAADIDAATPAVVLRANQVVVCSAAARAEGVRRGLRRREAQARCPSLVVLDDDPARDARAFEPVAAAIEALAPAVEIVRPGLCAVGSRGPSRYFGGDAALAERMATAAGHDAWAGVADGRFAATLAARGRRWAGAAAETVAVGERGAVVAPGRSAAFLAPLDIGVLDRPQLTDLLVRLGLHTLGDLAALPGSAVLARFGRDGAVAHRLARGLDERPLATRTPPPETVVTAELDPPADRVDVAAFAAKSLADYLGARLDAAGLACTLLRIEVETEHGEWLARRWRAADGFTSAMVADRVRWQLDGWLNGGWPERERRPSPDAAVEAVARDRHGMTNGTTASPPTGPITLLRLVPEEVVPDRGRQLGFWGGNADTDRQADRALARVQGLLGPEAVVVAVPHGGRSPAEQVRLIPWGEGPQPAPREGTRPTARPRGAEGPPPWPGRVPPPSPATVHARPLPAAVTAADGALVGVTGRGAATAEPAALAIGGRPPRAITAWAGPWPADERWWDPDAHRRRARFQLTTADGAAWLVCIEGGSWWVEGSYD